MLTPAAALQQHFGHKQFRHGQAETIKRVLRGRHTLLVMPTGRGKSLTYQLPALLQPGLTVVLSPLIALMQDQVDRLVARDIPATYINSSLSGKEISRRTRAMREGQVRLLYIAPERLRNRTFTRALANTKVGLLAVDEAHCVSQWGHDFRPDYRHIAPTWRALGQPPLVATTATATPAVQADIIELLELKQVRTIVTGFNRPNLHFEVIFTPSARTKLQALHSRLSNIDGCAIVYCATRRNTEAVANFINRMLSLPARAYHAGLDPDTRHKTQSDFMKDRVKVVVATNAFGLGVDKPNVRAVVHYNMPATTEAYYQEAGRAGRDGQPAGCTVLFDPDDYRLQQRLISSDTPTKDDLHQLYARLSDGAMNGEVHYANNELAELVGLHPLRVRVALSELEQAGALIHLGDQYGYNRWQVLPLSDSVLETCASEIKQRAQVRYSLLDNMLDYVHLTGCRRKFLLNYFGDDSPAQAGRCCDNHAVEKIEALPKAETAQEWAPLIVLETIRSYEQRPIGRKRLAQVLAGSQAKGMAQFGYDRHKFYGKLAGLTQNQITVLIDTLIAAKYIRHAGTDLPVLSLTETGRRAVVTRAALPIPVPDQLTYPGGTAREQSGPDYSSRAEHDAERTASPEATVLEAVARLDGTLGRTGLAQFLSGSRAAWLESYASHPAYGRLSQLSQQDVIRLIDALIAAGKLMTTGGPRPKVVGSKTSPKNKQADPPPIVPKVTAQTEPVLAPETTPSADAEAAPSPDAALLEALRTWRTDQARVRRVRPYLIASNRLLAAIASRRPATLEELGTITGIGPAKLANYGEAIIAIVNTGEYLHPDGDDKSADNASAAGITVEEDLHGYHVIAGS